MIPIFIVSNRRYAGKTLLAIGLGLKLMELGHSVGYIKPIGKTPVKQGTEVYDADALFIREALSLTDPMDLVSPVVLSYEMQNQLYEGKPNNIRQTVMNAFNSLRAKDYIIVGGSGDVLDGAAFDCDALSLIEELDGRALMVDAWRGDLSLDTFIGGMKLFGPRFAGGVINKAPGTALQHVKEKARPFLEKRGVKIFGVFQRDGMLESITVRQLIEILHGRVLCCEDRLDEFVEHFSIGAMDVDNALAHFRRIPNKAVITGAHRADIQLVAMETSTKCIILTGGLSTNDVVLGRAVAKGIPIISVPEDTFTTIDRIEGTMGKTRIREHGKIERAREIITKEFAMERFLEALKV